jgi:mRNA interferase MazF
LVDLGQPIGHEAGAARPGLVVSDDPANTHGLVVMCPITRARRGYPTHVEIERSGSGLEVTSYVQTEHIRTVSTWRLTHRLGTVDLAALSSVERSLRFLLRL